MQVSAGVAAKRDGLGRGEEVRSDPTPPAEHGKAAGRRVDLRRVDRALGLVEERLKVLDYVGAQLEIEEVSPKVKTKEAAERLEVIAESVRRDEEAFLAILEMIRKRPVRLERIRRDGTGEIADADSTGYTVRVGQSSYKAPWSRMPAGELCALAEMAAGDDIDSLVNLALFCAGRGSYRDYMKVKGRLTVARGAGPVGSTTSSGRRGGDPLARFAMRFERLDRESGGAPPPGGASLVLAAKAGGGDEREPADDAADDAGETATGTGDEADGPPKYIYVDCPVCHGTGLLQEMGCPICTGTGWDGINRCANCGGTRRVKHNCPYCRGSGSLVRGGKGTECPRCKGKGKLACPKCRGEGNLKRENPEFSGKPTMPCPYCEGGGFTSDTTCIRCGGKGKYVPREGRSFIISHVNCPFCGGDGKGPPLCPRCRGAGVRGHGKNAAICTSCLGTGRQFLPCRACRGNGWIPTKTKKR